MKPRPLHIKAIRDTSSSGLAAKVRSRRWLCRSAWLLVGYTVLGFLILPFVIRRVAISQLSKELHREVSIESVRLNPYALSVTIRGLKIKDPDGETLLGWDEVYVNLQIVSFFGHPWVFDEVAVVNPSARVQMNKDRTLNFSDIIAAHTDTNAPAEKATVPTKLPSVRIGQLRLEGARVAITDLTPKKPFHRIIGPVKVSITDFRTDRNRRNPHVFTGSTETGETFTWGGQFLTDPPGAVGEFGLENVSLNKLSPLYEDFVNFEIRDGVAGFHANYQFQLGQATNVATISNVSFTLRSFKLGVPGATENLVELPEFSVSGVSGDLLARRAEVGSVIVRGANFNLTREKGAAFNVVAAAQPNTNQSAPGGIMLLMSSVTNAFAQLLHSTNLATGTVREIAVQDCAVNFHDDSGTQPVNLRLDQINFSAKNISNRPETNLTTTLALRWNTNGMLKVEVNAALDPLNADLDLRLDQIELAPFSPYLAPYMNLYVLGSKVGLDGRILVRTERGQIPTVTFTGSAALDELNIVGGDASDDLLKWSALHFDGITANLNPPAVTITNILLKDVAARVVIETNKVINVLALVRTNTAGELTAPNETLVAASAGSGGSAIKRAFAQVKTLLGMETNTAAAGLPSVNIRTVQLENNELQFLDRSVTPPARAALQKIHGTIQNISTEEMQRAQVQIEMLAGGTGPIEITGQLNPLRAKQATEAKLSLKSVALNPADPYAAKFLGYRLTHGKLNVEVAYEISQSHLKGHNLIVLDQLTLGAKVPGPDATTLPVKLGIALLKDTSGKIEIDVPVEGNLDDPEFRLGKVIWHVIGNIFVKAITSPFSLLGSLVGGGKGGEEMQFQEFAPGGAELDVAAREKLANVAQALAARPELELEIEGNVQPERDGLALRRAKLELQLRTEYWKSLRPSARASTTPAQVALAPEVRADLLAGAYREALKANPQLSAPSPSSVEMAAAPFAPSSVARPRADLTKGAARLLAKGSTVTTASSTSAATVTGPTGSIPAGDALLTPEKMEQTLVAAQKISDEEFSALAQARAQQVQTNLVQELKVAAGRVLVSDPGPGGCSTNGNRVNLQLR